MALTTMSSVFVGIQMLRRNPLRTLLSTLGVIIGVGSLMAILNLGDSLVKFSRDQIERTTDLQVIEVSPLTTERIEGITLNRQDPVVFTGRDVDSLGWHLNGKAWVTLSVIGSQWFSMAGDTGRFPSVLVATMPGAKEMLLTKVKTGKFFDNSDAESDANVAVLSHRVAEKLAGGQDLNTVLGKEVIAGNVTWRVIGILEAGKNEQVPLVYVPYTSVPATDVVRTSSQLPRLMIKVVKIEEFDGVHQEVRRWLEQRFGSVERQFSVTNPRQRHEQVRQGMLVFKLIMGCITGISLVVGGIGIMNVLLASVSERTREIGIRRASGARKRDILMQFLIESVSISGLGGFCGVVLGYLVTVIALAIIRSTTEAPLETATTAVSILIAFSASFVVGVVFGLYPALRASRLSPTDAIRYE